MLTHSKTLLCNDLVVRLRLKQREVDSYLDLQGHVQVGVEGVRDRFAV